MVKRMPLVFLRMAYVFFNNIPKGSRNLLSIFHMPDVFRFTKRRNFAYCKPSQFMLKCI